MLRKYSRNSNACASSWYYAACFAPPTWPVYEAIHHNNTCTLLMRMHCQIMLTMKLQNTSSGVLIQFSTVLWVSRLLTPRELPDFAYVLPTSCAHLFQNDAVSARSSSESLDSVPTWPDRALVLGEPVVAFITCHMLVSRYPHISFIHYLFFHKSIKSSVFLHISAYLCWNH